MDFRQEFFDNDEIIAVLWTLTLFSRKIQAIERKQNIVIA